VPADSDTVFRKDTAGIWPELIERATTKHTKADGGWRVAEGAFGSQASVIGYQSSVDF